MAVHQTSEVAPYLQLTFIAVFLTPKFLNSGEKTGNNGLRQEMG
jgi:hypothetical protein